MPKNLKEVFLANNLGWRLLLALFFTICLAAFLHFREVRVEVLELGATANKYIVAQVDFEYVDPETMILLKQDVIRNLGTIFRVDESSIREARVELEK